MKEKDDIRKDILKLRNALTTDEATYLSEKIITKLTKMDEYNNSSCIMVYMDFKNEVNTMSLVKKMLNQGKRVVIPYTDIINTLIIPVEIRNIDDDLTKCKYGYLEPKQEKIIPFDVENIDFIIVPGVVFDKRLNRIGFGKGYYDRLLMKRKKNVKAVAIAYEFQVLDYIPSEEHDIKMDEIITESNIYKLV